MAPLPSGSYGRELRFTVLAPLIRVFLAFGVDQICKAFRLEIFFPVERTDGERGASEAPISPPRSVRGARFRAAVAEPPAAAKRRYPKTRCPPAA